MSKQGLVEPFRKGSVWKLLEADGGPHAADKSYSDRPAAVRAARKINRRRKGLPPDNEAFDFECRRLERQRENYSSMGNAKQKHI